MFLVFRVRCFASSIAWISSQTSSVPAWILIPLQVDLKSRVLAWNNPMDELYLSAPKNTEGSDRVFVTPHIDGFVGWIPFVRQWRCVYGLTGPHDTVTVQPMRNPHEREILLSPGVFTCFDFNREIHWIENRPSNHTAHKVFIARELFCMYS